MRRRKGSRGPSKVVVLEKYLHLLSNIWNERDPTYVLLINTSFPERETESSEPDSFTLDSSESPFARAT